MSRPFLGVFGLPLNAQRAKILDLEEIDHGLLLQEVSINSPAWQAGLRSGEEFLRVGSLRIQIGGDILLAIDGQPIDSPETVSKILQARTIGDSITLTIYRDGGEIEVPATLSERPALES